MDLEKLLNTQVDVASERDLKERIRERVLAIMRDVDERFLDMLEAIQRIRKYASRGRPFFLSNERTTKPMMRARETCGLFAICILRSGGSRDLAKRHISHMGITSREFWDQSIAVSNKHC